VSREAWSAMFVTFGLVDWEPPMTTGSAPAGSASEAISSSAPPTWPWRWTALILAVAAQLITISPLVSADPIAATWSSVLLAIAPASLAAAAAFAPAPVNRLAAVVLAVGGVGLWREQS
jgi:hypothetical protein